MIEYMNDCVNCDRPCDENCRYRHNPHYFCDECGKELAGSCDIWELDSEYHLCDACMKNYAKEHFDFVYKKIEEDIAGVLGFKRKD